MTALHGSCINDSRTLASLIGCMCAFLGLGGRLRRRIARRAADRPRALLGWLLPDLVVELFFSPIEVDSAAVDARNRVVRDIEILGEESPLLHDDIAAP